MATPEQNEKRLDEAEAILRAVIKDTRSNLRYYEPTDLLNLQMALLALNGVTLRRDI
jgi:signal transduction histidine kinase